MELAKDVEHVCASCGYFGWGAPRLGLGIGGGAAEFVSSTVGGSSGLHNALFSPHWQVSVGFSFGVPALLAQYLMLRYFFPESIRWLAPTTIGLAIGVVCGGFAGLAIVIWGSAWPSAVSSLLQTFAVQASFRCWFQRLAAAPAQWQEVLWGSC